MDAEDFFTINLKLRTMQWVYNVLYTTLIFIVWEELNLRRSYISSLKSHSFVLYVQNEKLLSH